MKFNMDQSKRNQKNLAPTPKQAAMLEALKSDVHGEKSHKADNRKSQGTLDARGNDKIDRLFKIPSLVKTPVLKCLKLKNRLVSSFARNC
jgi:hypothetical protein